MIKVNVRKLREEPLELEEKITVEEFEFLDDDYVKFIKPCQLHIKVSVLNDLLLCHIKAASRFTSFCCRSLEKLERDWNASFYLDFPVDAGVASIEIGEDIRQEILTLLPQRLLSDKEAEKEKAELKLERKNKKTNKQSGPQEQQMPTYQPFAHLKDLGE